MSTYAEKTSGKSTSTTPSPKKSGKPATFQFVDNRPETKQTTQLQTQANSYTSQKQTPIQKKNNTGLPDNLKTGIENLSGYAMDDVKVHYNSPKPAQLQAHAYAQGTDIHVASGQEKHLPHEAWHVVQQKQGRVQPTKQLKSVNINDDNGLEKEADVMGAKALNADHRQVNQFKLLDPTGTYSRTQQQVSKDLYSGKDRIKYGLICKKLKESRSGFSDKDIERILDEVSFSKMAIILSWSIDKIEDLLWNLHALEILKDPSNFMVHGRFSASEMTNFHSKVKTEREQEIERLRTQKLASSFLEKWKWKDKLDKIDLIRVGVIFRTDSRGAAHIDHDLKAIASMNNLGLPFRIVGVTLPRGANGGESPNRKVSGKDLDGIDMLYVPGGPTANDTQVGETEEEREFNKPLQLSDPGIFNKPKPPKPDGAPKFDSDNFKKSKKLQTEYEATDAYKKYLKLSKEFIAQREYHQKKQSEYNKYQKDIAKHTRVLKEHTERGGYELKLIEMAKSRGIPIMAVCAGSWRLLQSYGGQVRTLPQEERSVHKAEDRGETWQIGHGVDVDGSSFIGQSAGTQTHLGNVNTTHWAVANEKSGKFVKHAEKDPNELIKVSARTGKGITTSRGDENRDNEKTVEAFESKFGAPNLGIQWHPEGYLPGMLGESSGSKEIRSGSRGIFKAMAQASHSSRVRRQQLNREIRGETNNEPQAYELLKESIQAFFHRNMTGAGNIYREILSIFPRDSFSGRMEELEDALKMWEDSKKLGSGNYMKAEGLRVMAAQSLLKHGINIYMH